MCRKLTVLIFVVFMLGLVSNAPAAEYPGKYMELKVDFGYSDDPSTWKDGWLPWASWNDEDRHDAKLFANIGGSTIDACISVGHEGDLALGQDLEDNVEDEPMCNSFMHYYRTPIWYYDEGKDPGHPLGDILLFLTREGGLEPGEYWLYSYHRHPADMNDIQKIEVTCSKDGRWPKVTGQYAEYGRDPIDEQWLTGDINCPNYPGDPCGGVFQIHDDDTFDINVPIEGDPNNNGDPCHDADLTPSLVKFYTDGRPVLIRYWAPDDGSCAVLNAFRLLGPIPKAAWGPLPRHGAEDVCPDANLTWHSGEYIAYDTDANGHDVYFGTDLRDKFVLLDDGFEGGVDANWTASNWSQYDANGDGNSHSGRYSATPGSGSGTLTSIALDASYARSLEVELWLHKSEEIGAGDINLYYYDGNNWDPIADLNSLGPSDVWLHYTDEVTDSQYMVSTFKLELRSDISSGEVFVDDVLVVNTWPVGDQWFIDNRDPCNYDPPGLMDFNTTYYWRIDEVNNANPNSPWRGSTWSFTTEDGKAYDPSPGDDAWSVPTDANLSWTASCLAIKHDVYWSTNFADVNTGTDPNSGAGQGRQTETTFDLPILEPFTRYYWRVDEKGATTFIKGDVWTFMTVGGVLMYYKFDGVEDANIGDAGDANLVTDSTGNVTFRKRGDYTSLTYGLSNPLINPGGTSAQFHQWEEDIPDEDDIQHRVGLLRDAEGPDILDLAGEAYTIEMWVRQDSFYSEDVGDDDYAATLFRKYNRSYVLAIGEDNIVRYGHSGSIITSAPDANYPVEIELERWYHIAAVFDSTDPCESQRLYINGEQVSDGNTSSLNPLNDDDYVGIGFTKQPQRVGPGLEQNYFNGLIDELRVTDVALNPNQFLIRGGPGQAWFPKPQDYSRDIQFNVDLSWRPGDYTADVNGHDVYIGTDWYEVNEANATVHPNVGYANLDVNSYDIPYYLSLDQTHYWRVDEVSDSCSPYLWKGAIWRFTVPEYIIIDDMENYVEGYAKTDYTIAGSSGSYGWETFLNGPSYGGSCLDLVTPTRNSWIPSHGGVQAMAYVYVNGDYYYSEIANHFVLDPCDWTYGGIKMLSLWFYGDPLNDPDGQTQQMYVGLEDADSNYAEVRYGDNEGEDMDNVKIEEYHQWNMPLSWFTTANPDLDLTRMKKLYIGFGDRTNTTELGSDGTVYFDDIRLYPPTCILSKRTSQFAELDLDDDCIISFGDVELMAEEWLKHDVNLGQVSEPCDANLIGWWNFDEDDGDGNVVTDSSGKGHHGVIETNDVNVWWVAGRNDVNYALDFNDGRVLVPDAAELRPMHKVSVCAWIYYSDEQSSGRIVVKGADNKETYGLEVGGEDELVFNVRDGNDPNAEDYPKYDAKSDEDALDRDEWIHAAGTYDGNTVKCYINGELAAESNDPNTSAIPFLSQDTNDLAIGNRPDAMDKPFKGIIDDVRVYNYGLSAAEVAYLATDGGHNGIGIFRMQSVANLYFGEPLGSGAVNLRDFAKLSDAWLEEKLWPEPE